MGGVSSIGGVCRMHRDRCSPVAELLWTGPCEAGAGCEPERQRAGGLYGGVA